MAFNWRWLFPQPMGCVFCSRPAARTGLHRRVEGRVPICAECNERMGWIDTPRCKQCGRQLGGDDPKQIDSSRDQSCGDCIRIANEEGTEVLVKNRAVVQYSPLARQVIGVFKYRGRETLATPCGKLMADLVRHEYREESIKAITYVPLHPRRQAVRGFNQAELLANRVGKELRLPVYQLLTRTKDTPKQSKQSRAERIAGMEAVFRICFREERNFYRQGTFLMVDDVYTTGTTLSACARELRRVGASRVIAVTFAR